ncbi:MAG TPA: PilZ domain-containing protein [Candidatus Dormibacteraeota bacterium]|nr:PilZ domain-containing protein [Candidatus Dormibacteraeota bacterium]
MPEPGSKSGSPKMTVRDRRYAIRFPFAADVSLIDLESGATADGVTSDISFGGCFVCTSKSLALKSRVRVTLTRKEQTIEALGVVRAVKPRVGLGVEFLDLEQASYSTLERWIEQIRRER